MLRSTQADGAGYLGAGAGARNEGIGIRGEGIPKP